MTRRYPRVTTWAEEALEAARPGSLYRTSRRRVAARYVVASGAGVALIATGRVVAEQASGGADLAVAVLLALVPLLIVLVTVRWIDRWEPEPTGLKALAFTWGAGVAALVSLVVNTTTGAVATGLSGDAGAGGWAVSVLSAPVIEETTKACGVLVIVLLWRRAVGGPVDGIVYAALVAAGFAFTENAIYFIQYRTVLVETFVWRGLASPFAHVTFTACTGLALGLSVRRPSPAAWVWYLPVGLAGAIALHMFWNGVVSAFPGTYLLVEVPFFLLCVVLVAWLRWSERMTLCACLQEYADAGWLAPGEVHMLTTGAGRRAMAAWASRQGPAAQRAVRELTCAATELASLRVQARNGHAGSDYAERERELLAQVRRARERLAAPAGAHLGARP